MQLHITDVHRPQSTSRMALSGSVVDSKPEPVNTGMLPVMVLGRKTASRMRAMPRLVAAIIMARLDTLEAMSPATKRPTSMRNQ